MISQLNASLKREKSKSQKLGSMVTKLQGKNQDINEVIEDCMKNTKKDERSM